MADRAHILTDEKLEQMERHLSAIYSRAKKTVQKKMADYAKTIDEKSAELLQAYNDSETEDEKRKAKRAYIRFYRQVVKSKEFVSLSANVADDLYKTNIEATSYINSQTAEVYAINYNGINKNLQNDVNGFIPQTIKAQEAEEYGNLSKKTVDKTKDIKWNEDNLKQSIVAGAFLLLGTNVLMKRAGTITVKKNHNSSNRNNMDMVGEAETKGRIDAMYRASAMGVEIKKRWRTAGDNRVRDSHAKLDGVEVAIDEKFPNKMDRPKDPDGDPSEYYNCRCTLEYNVGQTKGKTRSARQGEVTGSYKKASSFKGTKSIEVANMPYKELMEWLNRK